MKRVILKGGLGNQLFQLAESLILGEENIKLDWCIGRPVLDNGKYPQLSAYILPPEFQWSKPRTTIDRIFKPTLLAKDIVNEIFEGRKTFENLSYLSKLRLFSYSQKVSLLVPRFLKSHRPPEIVVGYFQKEPKLGAIYEEKLKQIKLRDYSEILDRFKAEASKAEPLIVHMRIGDYEKNSNFGVLTGEYYREAIDFLAKRIPNFAKVPIWLFSDSPEKAVIKFPAEYKNQMRLIPNSIETAAETLEIMRLGKYFVISNSTFSWWSAYLSPFNDKIVIAPDPWFNNIEVSSELIPDSWSKIPSEFLVS